jgi:hypothetical protein
MKGMFCLVAQSATLLFRRMLFGSALLMPVRLDFPRSADWQSATQQDGILRYRIAQLKKFRHAQKLNG